LGCGIAGGVRRVNARVIGLVDPTALRKFGARVAIDDFGTGYSSLGALRYLPAGTLKIV
jgi:predicted signal transduction protein with EAL and GGDEF domain